MSKNRRNLSLAAIGTAAVLLNGSLAMAQTYTGANNGSWDVAGNWSPATVPNSPSVGVVVNNAATVVIPGGDNHTIGTLTVGTGGGINIGSNAYLAVYGATFSDAGTVTLSSGGDTRFRTGGQTLTISGNGTINSIGGLFDGGGTIVNSAGHSIRGYGNFGLNSVLMNNAGTIDANSAGNTFTVDIAGLSTNTGTMSASGGGLLSLTGSGGGNFNNTGGTVIANTGSIVELTTSAEVFGGTLTTSGTGILRAGAGQYAYAHDFTNAGNLRLADGAYFQIYGNVVNNSSITFDNVGGNTRLRTNGVPLNLTGTGTINMATGGIIDGGSSLSIGSGQTISGQGNVGLNSVVMANAGKIDASVNATTLTLDPANTTNTNTGTLSATNGGNLLLTGSGGGNFNNTGGTIVANTGSTVTFNSSAEVFGGTLNSVGTGILKVATGDYAYLHDLTNTAAIHIATGAFGNVYGNIVNNGSITLDNAVGGDTRLRGNSSAVNFSGTGTINMPTGGSIDLATTVTFGANQTVQGQGNIGQNNTLFVNNGLVQANVSGAALTLDPANSGSGFDNNATIRAINGGIIVLTGNGNGVFENTGGIIRAEAGSQVQMAGSSRVINGTLTTLNTGKIFTNPGETVYLNNITNGGDFHLGNGSDTYFNTSLVNNSTVTFDTTTANTRLRTEGVDLAISGTGSIEMAAGGQIDGGARITLGSGQTVRGQGSIGLNNTLFTNNALIDANISGKSLTIDPANAANAFVNNATIRASAGGILSLTGNGAGDFSGGTVTATGVGSEVQLSSSVRLIGATVSTSSSGVIRVVAGNVAYLQGVTIANGLTLGGNSDTYIEGTLANNGVITGAPANASNIRLRTNGADVSITGTGSILLNNTAATSDDVQIDGGGTVTLGSGQLVHGSGSIGLNNTAFINNGIVDADNAAGGIGVDPANSVTGFTNNNIMRATGGGKLALSGNGSGAFNNAATATISATGAGSEVQLSSSVQIVGGTITTSSGGLSRLVPGNVAYLSGVTNSGAVRLEAGSDLYLNGGNLTNTGTITLAPTVGGSSAVRLRTDGGDHSILGTGTIVLANSATVDATIDGGGRVTIGAGQTITGSGSLGVNNTAFTNNGTIVSPSGGIGIDPSNSATAFVNNGTLKATTGGLILLSGYGSGAFSGGGVVVADASSTIRADNNASVDFQTNMTGAGTLAAVNASDVTFTSYRNGTVTSASNSYVRIRANGGNAGTAKINALTIDTAGGGHFDVTNHGLIIDYTGASPAATIRGYLASGRNGGTWNGAGLGSSLANNNGFAVGYGEASQLAGAPTTFLGQTVDSTAIVTRFTLNGDATLDGVVNFDDLIKVAQNYNTTGTNTWMSGDFTYDGTVNFDDLIPIAQSYNASVPANAVSAAMIASLGGTGFAADWALAQSLVPEPTTLLAAAGLLTIAGRRRR